MTLLIATALLFSVGEKEFLCVAEDYQPAHAEVPHAWVGSSLYSHEILLLDPDEAPLVNACYEAGREIFIEAALKSLPTLLSTISTFLHTDVFTTRDNRHEVIDKISKSWRHPCIPLDLFIAHRTGVCRHFVLLAAYILARVQLESIVVKAPEIRIIRFNLPMGRHAWLQVGKWHFDPYWNLIVDLTDAQEEEFLYQVYGLDAIQPSKRGDYGEEDSLLWRFQCMGNQPLRWQTASRFCPLDRSSIGASRERSCRH